MTIPSTEQTKLIRLKETKIEAQIQRDYMCNVPSVHEKRKLFHTIIKH